jgi:hypothetical protein
VIQKDDKLCFVITPKMNLETLGDIQKMVEKYTHEKLLIRSISFDHQSVFIKAIDFEFRSNKDRTTMYGDNPHKEESISSTSFAIDLKTNKNSFLKTSNPSENFLTDTIPELSKVIAEDEQMVKSFIEKNKKLYNDAATESFILSKLNKNHTILGFNNIKWLVEKRRKVESESDFFIQKGDFLLKIDEKYSDMAVYMLGDKVLTDEELSKINISTIENVKLYVNDFPVPENTLISEVVIYILLIPKQ